LAYCGGRDSRYIKPHVLFVVAEDYMTDANHDTAAATKYKADIARLVRKMEHDQRRLDGLQRQLAELTRDRLGSQGAQAAAEAL
jgi:hypothetical protein